ncbi:MAG: gamma carbonic anhydrase family protein, partial [Turicibacter sp.]
MLLNYRNNQPHLHDTTFLAHNVVIIGNSTLKRESNIWFNVTIRGDLNKIVIGEQTNIQEGAVIHVTTTHPTIIGNGVTVGHGAILHGCTIHDSVLIGMGAIILDGALIEKESLVAAGCVVPPNKVVPARHLAMGNPMKIIRELTEEEIAHTKENAKLYVELA